MKYINPNDYEGHTPAPWNADDDGGGKHLHIDAYGEEGDVCVARMVNGNWIDTQLIADAPLLLVEVKRLRDHIRRMRHWAEPKMHEVHHDAWRKLHEEIYEGDEEE
tara:strand:- start:86 stop:403 length:318 start_codon:yes stop_codon:yes gene_type:complete